MFAKQYHIDFYHYFKFSCLFVFFVDKQLIQTIKKPSQISIQLGFD